MIPIYKKIFGEKTKTKALSLLEHNDHPKLDNSELSDEERVQQYQLLIGFLQWTTSLG